MPRKPVVESPVVDAVRRELAAFLKQNEMSQSALGRAVGVGQPQVNRFLQGRTKTLTPQVQKMCDYAKIRIDNGIGESSSNRLIIEAVQRVWDGRHQTARLIAAVIEATVPLLAVTERSAPSRAVEPQETPQ